MGVPIPNNPFQTRQLGPRLSEEERLRAVYWQRQGLTFTEIADQLALPRDQVVRSLYWDVVEDSK